IDIAQWSVQMAGWMAPHLLDHEAVLAAIAKRDPDFDWGDFLGGSKQAASYDERLIGIPYRITTGILHYQKPLFDQAGIAHPPGTFAEFEKAALAVHTPPDRSAFGLMGRLRPGSYSSVVAWHLSAGCKLLVLNTGA